jgi:hypothetical protein
MNIAICSVPFTVSTTTTRCIGGVHSSMTVQEFQALNPPGLTWDEVQQLQGQVVILFAIVFAILVLKKLLR